MVSRIELEQVKEGMDLMNTTIESALEDVGAHKELEIWHLHKERINKVYENGGTGRGKKAPVHTKLLMWAIAFLAKTSASVYKEVAKVMKLPHISYIYKKTAEMISTIGDKGYAINIATIRTMGERAEQEKWTPHQRTGVLGQDSCNLNAGIEHDYVTNTLVGGDESHRLGDLSHMFQVLAQQVRDAQEEDVDNDEDGGPKKRVSHM